VAGFGNTLADIGLALDARVQREQRARADESAAIRSTRQLKDLEHQLLHDPEHGVLTTRGLEPMARRNDALERFDLQAGEIEKNLTNDAQRQRFEAAKAARRGAIRDAIDRHASQQLEVYDEAERQAALTSSRDAAIAAIDQPTGVARLAAELAEQDQIIASGAAATGRGPEATRRIRDELRSETLVGAINRLLALERDRDARDLYAGTQDQITGDQRARVEAALEEGSLRGESQRQADAIVQAGGTLTEQREQARRIPDPTLRDAVMDRVEKEAVVRARADGEQQEALLRRAYDLVDRDGSVDRIPPAEWTSLPGSARSALRAYARSLASSATGDVETDLVVYYRLQHQAATDPAAFATLNLLEYRHQLGKTEFKEFTQLQLDQRENRPGVPKILDGIRTDTQLFSDSMDELEITDEQARAAVRREWDRRVDQAQQAANHKPLSPTEKQELLDAVTLARGTVTLQRGTWFRNPLVDPFFDQTKPAHEVTLADIPVSDRLEIQRELRRRRRPATPEAIVDTYLKAKRRLGELR
jgi:hypothetical protein